MVATVICLVIGPAMLWGAADRRSFAWITEYGLRQQHQLERRILPWSRRSLATHVRTSRIVLIVCGTLVTVLGLISAVVVLAR
ncbi:MAG: hypothetical protein M3Q30_11685 [Actinomycetota bacterium]|nr:hypothetical protein [Actinomycetota bacterium]